MGTLSPDAEVSACPWFQLEKEQDKPTTRFNVLSRLQGGLTDKFLLMNLV